VHSYLVIADDFTGANDTGIQIRRRGKPVRVVFNASDISSGGSYVLDTESRFLSEEESFKKILAEVEKIDFRDFKHVFKKVDSALRGNIASEIRALSQCFKPDIIVFAPAFPLMGRTTVDGIQHLNGIPLLKTEFANDIKTPVKKDSITEIMKDAFNAPFNGSSYGMKEIIHIKTGEPGYAGDIFAENAVYCFDVQNNDDLDLIVHSALQTRKRILWVGSAALADALLGTEVKTLPAMAVIASLSSVSRAQVHYAEKQGISLVKIPLYKILEDPEQSHGEEIINKALSLLKNNKDIVLLPSSVYSIDEFYKTEEAALRSGLDSAEMSVFTQHLIGSIAVNILEKISMEGRSSSIGLSGIFLSGGDTAMAFMDRAEASGTEMLCEMAAGIPIMHLAGGKFDGLSVITKAGSFGNEDAVFQAIRKLGETGIVLQ